MTKQPKKARKPRQQTKICYADIHTYNDGTAEINVGYVFMQAKEARKLAAWLIAAANWIEGRE